MGFVPRGGDLVHRVLRQCISHASTSRFRVSFDGAFYSAFFSMYGVVHPTFSYSVFRRGPNVRPNFLGPHLHGSRLSFFWWSYRDFSIRYSTSAPGSSFECTFRSGATSATLVTASTVSTINSLIMDFYVTEPNLLGGSTDLLSSLPTR